jgi:hypothetical protein
LGDLVGEEMKNLDKAQLRILKKEKKKLGKKNLTQGNHPCARSARKMKLETSSKANPVSSLH